MTSYARTRVLVAIADLEQEARPRRVGVICRRAHFARRVVLAALRDLNDDGLVTVVHPHGYSSAKAREWTCTPRGWRQARGGGA